MACPLGADAYVAAGRGVEFPRLDCPSCAEPMGLWSGYWRYVRATRRCRKIFVPRERCGCCQVSHPLLPVFVLAWRLDTAETVGVVIGEVASGRCGARPAAERAGVPHTTARGWLRRFRTRAAETGVAFAALAVELGGVAIRVGGDRREADRGQHTLALPDRRQTAFHASCPAITGMRRQTAWTTGSKSRSHCTAGR